MSQLHAYTLHDGSVVATYDGSAVIVKDEPTETWKVYEFPQEMETAYFRFDTLGMAFRYLGVTHLDDEEIFTMFFYRPEIVLP